MNGIEIKRIHQKAVKNIKIENIELFKQKISVGYLCFDFYIYCFLISQYISTLSLFNYGSNNSPLKFNQINLDTHVFVALIFSIFALAPWLISIAIAFPDGPDIPPHSIMKGRIIGLSSLIKYKFLKHKFKNQYKFTNASDPAVINTVIQYLIDGPIKLQQTILSQIDDTVAATNNHIGSLKQLIKELSSGDLLSGEIILESRISMANSCIDKLNIQLQELSVQKTDASNAIIPIKKMAKDLGVLNKSNNTIKTIQEALNITEFNTMIIEQNYQLISDLNIVCDNTINTLKDIQVHKISRSNAEEEITKLTIGAR